MTQPLIIPPIGTAGACASIVPPPAADDATVIANDGWFPDLALATFRSQMRLRASVTVARQRDAVLNAIIWAGDNLAPWQIEQVAAGAASLAAVPAPVLGGESRLIILYRQAVFAWAKAELVERYRDVDTTAAGQRDVDDLDSSTTELRRDAIHAIRALLGRNRTDVELI